MKRLTTLALATGLLLSLPSCMTTYDAQGRPVQSVDPGLAAVGIVGAGLLGAAIASDNNDDYYHHKPHHDHHSYKKPCNRNKHYNHYSHNNYNRHHGSRHYNRPVSCY